MKSTPRTTVPFRRKRKGLTNYKKRIALLKSGKVRLVIRKSLNNIVIQCVQYKRGGDKVLLTVHSSELKKYGWKAHRGNIPTAYLTGFLVGAKAKKLTISEVVIDFGLQSVTKGSRLYAAVKGAMQAGLTLSVPEQILPSEAALGGKFAKNVTEGVEQAIMQGV